MLFSPLEFYLPRPRSSAQCSNYTEHEGSWPVALLSLRLLPVTVYEVARRAAVWSQGTPGLREPRLSRGPGGQISLPSSSLSPFLSPVSPLRHPPLCTARSAVLGLL